MARFDVSKLTRPEVRIETQTFIDPKYPDMPWELSVRVVQEGPFLSAIGELGRKYVADYVTGRNGGLPAPLLKIDGETVTLTEPICQGLAYIQQMQWPPTGEDGVQESPLTFDELVKIAVTSPRLFFPAWEWASSLLTEDAPNP